MEVLEEGEGLLDEEVGFGEVMWIYFVDIWKWKRNVAGIFSISSFSVKKSLLLARCNLRLLVTCQYIFSDNILKRAIESEATTSDSAGRNT